MVTKVYTVCVLILIWCPVSVLCQTESVTAAITDSPNIDPEVQDTRRPIDRAADPAYTATNFFLEVIIQPEELNELNRNVNLSDPDAVLDSLKSDWPTWLKHYTGYLVCLVLAGVYILAMIITGFAVCGSRLRGKCGASQGPMDRKHTKHKRRVCAIVLGVVFVCLMFGVVVMFLTNFLVYEQTEDTGVPSVLSESLSRFENFKDTAKENYKFFFQNEFQLEVRDLVGSVEAIPTTSQEKVGLDTGVGPLLDVIIGYVSSLNGTTEDLLTIDTVVATIIPAVNTLNSVISDLKSNTTRDFSSCRGTDPDCEAMLSLSAMLGNAPDFSSLPSMEPHARSIESHLTGPDNVYHGLSQALAEFSKISQIISDVSGHNISVLASEIERISLETNDFIDKAFDLLDSVTLDDAKTYINESVNPKIEEYGQYRYYGGLALSSVVLLVIAVCGFGLLCGACGTRAGDRNNCCDKKTSAHMLKFALGLVFVFSWLWMIVPAIVMPLGGIAHNDICRNLLSEQKNEDVDIIDDIMRENLNLSFSFYDLYRSCRNGETIYSALRMEERGEEYNITALFDPSSYNVQDPLNEIKTATYYPGNIVLLNNVLESKLQDLENILSSVDLSLHQEKINGDFNVVELENMTKVSAEAAIKNKTNSDLFQFYSNRLWSIQRNELADVVQRVNSLRNLINSVNSFVTKYNITDTAQRLGSLQNTITPLAITNGVSTVSDDVFETYQELLAETEETIRNDLSHCETISNAVSDTLESVCISFLYPFNAFWFSLGWCLFFFIWLIPINLILSDYYRKTEPYSMGLPSLEQPILSDNASSVNTINATSHYNQDADLPNYFLTTADVTPYDHLPSSSGSIDGNNPEGTNQRLRQEVETDFRTPYAAPKPWQSEGYQSQAPPPYHASATPANFQWDNFGFDNQSEPLDTWDGPVDTYRPQDTPPRSANYGNHGGRNYPVYY